MTIVMLQCECSDVNLVLAVNTVSKKLMGYCPKCRKLYDILDVNLTDDDLASVEKSMGEVESSEGAMFYLRCTELLGMKTHPF